MTARPLPTKIVRAVIVDGSLQPETGERPSPGWVAQDPDTGELWYWEAPTPEQSWLWDGPMADPEPPA